MTLNKMVWNFWHQFLIRFSMLFQMVPFILLCMVAHLTITWLVETIPTANQRALCWWFLKLPWREKRKVPSERAMKIESETGVKSDTPFCLRLPIEKTNSVVYLLSVHVPDQLSLFPHKIAWTCCQHSVVVLEWVVVGFISNKYPLFCNKRQFKITKGPKQYV